MARVSAFGGINGELKVFFLIEPITDWDSEVLK